MTGPCGLHDEHWLAYRNPVDVKSERYCLFCEVERLRRENATLLTGLREMYRVRWLSGELYEVKAAHDIAWRAIRAAEKGGAE